MVDKIYVKLEKANKENSGGPIMKLTPEEKKQREIQKWEHEKAKPKGKGYTLYFLFLIGLIYLCDEVVSQIGGQMQSVIASQIFAPIVGEKFAVARMSAYGTLTAVAAGLAILYKPLSDRFGRHPFLFINTVGMGIACIVISLSTNIPVYLIGTAISAFFTPHDMQAVYIQECAPPEHRARWYSSIKAVATLGMLMIPALRSVFIPDGNLSNWRMVYMLPGLITVAAGIASFFLIRESDAFVDNRLKQLRMTPEEIEAAKRNKQDVQAKGGLIHAVKYVFRNKQVRWLTIAGGFIMAGMLITSYYETIMTYGYAQQYLDAGMDLESAKASASVLVTKALMLFGVGSALFQFFPGFLADAIGRKKTAVVMTGALLASFLIFYFGSANAINPYVIGFFCGAAVGGYWYTGDLVALMVTESTPTNLRVSTTTAVNSLSGNMYMFAMIGVMILTNIMGDAAIGKCVLYVTVPAMAIGLLILMFKVKETKGIDLSTIDGANN